MCVQPLSQEEPRAMQTRLDVDDGKAEGLSGFLL